MFSKLVFTENNQEIDFPLHEVVRIAMSILDGEAGEPVNTPSPATLNFIFDDIMECGRFAFAAIEGSLDCFLLIPRHIRGMKASKQWLFVAKRLYTKPSEDDSTRPIGRWFVISDRLILSNTSVGRVHFYVSDHGYLSDIIQNVIEHAIDLNWLNAELTYKIFMANKELEQMSPDEIAAYKNKYIESIANDSPEMIKQFHPKIDYDEIKNIQELLRSDREYADNEWRELIQSNYYLLRILVERFLELKFKTMPNFDHFIYYLFSEEAIKADKLIKYIVLASLAKEINLGNHQPLYRPIFSYGDKDKGDSYSKFAVEIEKYFLRPTAISEAELAKLMRKILLGESIMIIH